MARLIIRFQIRKRREVTSIQNELPSRKRGHLSPLAYHFRSPGRLSRQRFEFRITQSARSYKRLCV